MRRFPNLEIVIARLRFRERSRRIYCCRYTGVEQTVWGIDVIIAGRGGGSFEDLMAFNEEKVVRAFAASKLPIISAVGHQIDSPLSDLAADVAATTP
jgi:exodeoxyribonuclease VII large subunit